MGRSYEYPRGSRLALAHHWVASMAYWWGAASGTRHGYRGGRTSVRIFWRGKRCYFLRWPRWKWRCLLRFRHWPTDYTVVFDLCGRCCPWPCCGAITVGHAPGCTDGEGVTPEPAGASS